MRLAFHVRQRSPGFSVVAFQLSARRDVLLRSKVRAAPGEYRSTREGGEHQTD